MNKKFLVILFILISFKVAKSQTWDLITSLSGSGTTSMKANSSGDILFTTASYNYPTGQSAGIYRINLNSFLIAGINPASGFIYNARTIEPDGLNDVWVSCWTNPSLSNEALYYSSNKGNSWERKFDIGPSNNIFSIQGNIPNDDDMVFIGARNGVYKSTNNGNNFSISNTGIPTNSWTYDLEYTSSKLMAATSNGLYRSIDNGGNWAKVNGIPHSDTVKSLSVIPSSAGNKIIAGTSDGELYISDEDLLQFGLVFGFDNSDIIAMLVLLGVDPFSFHIFTSAFPNNFDNIGNGLFSSYNSTTNWSNYGNGLPSPYKISALGGYISGNIITTFAGTFDNTSNGAKIFKKTNTVGIVNLSSTVPESFSISQNYPNPFNPVTKIKFDLRVASLIKLSVYNSLGKEIIVLVNEKLNPGTYETEFNGSEYSSGVYFYRIESYSPRARLAEQEAENFIETKQMMLVK